MNFKEIKKRIAIFLGLRCLHCNGVVKFYKGESYCADCKRFVWSRCCTADVWYLGIDKNSPRCSKCNRPIHWN